MDFENDFELGILFLVEQQGTWGIITKNINKSSTPSPLAKVVACQYQTGPDLSYLIE